MRINTLFGTKEVTEGVSRPMTLYYYLIQETGKGKRGGSVYGVGIVKQCGGETTEQEYLVGLSDSREETEGLLRLMLKGAVTPMSAVEVADDYLGA